MAALEQHRSPGVLEFHAAMNDFKTMFPNMDSDVIEVVLRSNNGAVDATIDQLLAMNVDSENERSRQGADHALIAIGGADVERPRPSTGTTPPPSYNQGWLHTPGIDAN